MYWKKLTIFGSYSNLVILDNVNMINKEELNKRLNLLNYAKKTNIAKINVESIEFGRVKYRRIFVRKHYEHGMH